MNIKIFSVRQVIVYSITLRTVHVTSIGMNQWSNVCITMAHGSIIMFKQKLVYRQQLAACSTEGPYNMIMIPNVPFVTQATFCFTCQIVMKNNSCAYVTSGNVYCICKKRKYLASLCLFMTSFRAL